MLKPDAALRKDRTTDATLEHRHFAFIAAVIEKMQWLLPDEQRKVANAFANACARTNPRFDRARFLRACNVEG